MFSFFKKKPQDVAPPATPASAAPQPTPVTAPASATDTTPATAAGSPAALSAQPLPAPAPAKKSSWLDKLKSGLSRTSSGITTLFTGTRIDEDLYDEL